MGLLTTGEPLSWSETKAATNHIRCGGIEQFIQLYHHHKDRLDENFLWGDEIEYILVKFDHAAQKVRVSLRAEELLKKLQRPGPDHDANLSVWQPEFGAYMLESTPARPYNIDEFERVEESMRARRAEVTCLLEANETILTMATFPTLGTFDFTFPPTICDSRMGVGRSIFFPDEAIFQGHPRFLVLANNIRQRRGEKVSINAPLYKDLDTPRSFKKIYMDAMGFGMGCCALQVTLQAKNLNEARYLYDQLTPLAPLLLAMTASSPAFRGQLSDLDTRWSVISQSVDDRTPDEMTKIPKSRFDSVSMYIHPVNSTNNDQEVVTSERAYQELTSAGVDSLLSGHVSHLFIRDPLVVLRDCTDNFDNIQSTNWQTVRFKPPPLPPTSIGWRVEFRSMEVQPSDFENAAFSIFIILISRFLLSMKLNLTIPISKVDENMRRAQKRDALLLETFHFPATNARILPLTLSAIFNGSPDFPGLLPMLHRYLTDLSLSTSTHILLNRYLHFISQRATGANPTPAHAIRNYIVSHSDYKRNSVVGEKIIYHLLRGN